MYFAGYSTYWSPAGILMASLGPREKQREAFKLQANTPDPLSHPSHSSPPVHRSHFALRTFLRAILILTRAGARHSSATRCRRCTLIFQKNAHCVHRPPFVRFHPVVPPCSLSSLVLRAHLRNKKKAEEKKSKWRKEFRGRIPPLVPLARIKHSHLAITLCSRYHRDVATR